MPNIPFPIICENMGGEKEKILPLRFDKERMYQNKTYGSIYTTCAYFVEWSVVDVRNRFGFRKENQS